MTKRLTENQISAVELIAIYKYFTSSQFVKMGLYKARKYLTNALKPLLDVKKPLIAKYDFNPINGKLESFYYLTSYGIKFLIEELEYQEDQIKAPRGHSTIYLKDYFHRKYTIDFNINLRQWLTKNNGRMIFLNYYFDKNGNNRSGDKTNYVTSSNKILLKDGTSFIPDVNAMFSINQKEYIVLFEQHNGKDAKRLFEQLYIHMNAIGESAVANKYHIKKSPMVVVVCEEEAVKLSVIKNLQKINGIQDYNKFFIFKTNSELEADFYSNWTLISGEKTNFI